ncbi:hypothetical protein P8847_01165 [Bacillus inaquosorum]|uniref:Uncharacterized protein n=1 Tax=Bacillus inaquosorum KCTC 13429 TaxID=1236548 RepID=A0A9W5LJS8_9BACI|nr:hypothetical protein [Bacillus inaquosorum]RKQ26067.1 hypothetical protein D3797_008465 [Bacillus subtilis]AWM17668.1 hypothetical protein DKG76_13305 [Bacillus inaquosorum]ELS62006.1 hypothetical protein BSI_10850 [Bacillus inaquosorum KCTC 13429]MCY7756324.1 hypothetical protein [Bacillus inaquosorum]MCY7764636.1 hypothetical protein [Bacillus inaquosorum]
MEDILTNPLIIAVIIGIISAIFGKKNKEEKKSSQNRKEPQQMQTASPQKKQAEEVSVPIPNRMEQVRREAEERRRETERNLKGLERDLTAGKQKAVYTKQKMLQVNKDTVVQGIVLGEVFGPPRAKKPHHTMRSARKN